MKVIFTFIFAVISIFAKAQSISGTVIEKSSKEPIEGAKVFISSKLKVLTDEKGRYEFLNLGPGNYKIVVTSLDLDSLVQTVVISDADLVRNFVMYGGIELEEVKVIASLVPKGRVTPIAATTIGQDQIQKELGSQDIPMLLSGTPGVQATQKGGGDGDSRIVIRGFDQRNVGVMIDGVPVNDMENGAVYWSNWFGLDNITQNIQVQRGLGATKLAMPSVGGTLNIITQSPSKKGVTMKQEFGTGNLRRFSLSAASGNTKKGFSALGSVSYKLADGWVDGNFSEAFFIYGKIQQKYKNHLISLSAFAAPQKHGQRSFSQKIRYWDTTVTTFDPNFDNTPAIVGRGLQYNDSWGYETTSDGRRIERSERTNFYNKPQITLKDFWKVNEKLSISTMAYVSIGRGGGSQLANSSAIVRDAQGQINWDKMRRNNQVISIFGIESPNVDVAYSPTLLKSNQVVINSINNHMWTGLLGQFSYEHTKNIEISGGLDFRSYTGAHYKEIGDLLGGDYYVNQKDKNATTDMKYVGDKIGLQTFDNNRDGIVRWAGAFGQIEQKNDKFTSFVNVSVVTNFYKGVDYFIKKDSLTSDFNTTPWVDKTGYTVKTGGSYKLDKHQTVFVNLGYLSRTPQFSNVIDNNTNSRFLNIENELITAIEGGYSLSFEHWGFNLNGYYTKWQNKPIPFGVQIPDPTDPTLFIRANVSGMDALHYGGEIDIAWHITRKLDLEIMSSIGDWTWQSAETVQIGAASFTFDAKGVHVGDAAQSVHSASLKFEPFKNFYIKPQYQFYDKYYASFNPFDLKGDNARRDAWRLPSYGLMNLFVGYKIPVNKYSFSFNFNINNALNKKYIADANDGQFKVAGQDSFNSQTAGVFFGQGRRYNLGVTFQF